METNFKAGDEVQLKSGGPKMTIEVLDGDGAYCIWFSGLDKKADYFEPATIKRIKSLTALGDDLL